MSELPEKLECANWTLLSNREHIGEIDTRYPKLAAEIVHRYNSYQRDRQIIEELKTACKDARYAEKICYEALCTGDQKATDKAIGLLDDSKLEQALANAEKKE